jgi:hypothetical protein
MHTRLRQSRFLNAHPALVFWACFAALQALLFLPLFLLGDDTTTLLPPRSTLEGGWRLALNHLFIWRSNYDPFRLSVEFTLLVAIWVAAPRVRRPWLRTLVAAGYLFALLYYAYDATMASIWQLDANAYRELFLARDGLPFLLDHLGTTWWMYLGALAGLVAAGTAVLFVVQALLASGAAPGLRRGSRAAVVTLAALCVTAVALYRPWTARREMVVSSLGFKLLNNVEASLHLYQDIHEFDDSAAFDAYAYPDAHLARMPDIYLIFVESYGSVLYKRDAFRRTYLSLLHEIDGDLAVQGWQTASALSDSPTWGGGSWMAYSSVLMGLRIDNHPEYLTLFDRYQLVEYPTLGRTLQKQGYTYAWVSSIAEELKEDVWDEYRRFTGVDTQLRHRDLDYTGPHYGWGPAPPDQWVLNATRERLQAASDQPLFFATITQNSHFPWTSQPPLLADWHEFTEMEPGSVELRPFTEGEGAPQIDVGAQNQEQLTARRRAYLGAIDYQLRMLSDFILRTEVSADPGAPSPLFILVGDHQPPQVSGPKDGWATPVHVITRDGALLDLLAEYSFRPGLRVADLEPDLHHEGIYSLLMRVLLERYGDKQAPLPDYLPAGAPVSVGAETTAGVP